MTSFVSTQCPALFGVCDTKVSVVDSLGLHLYFFTCKGELLRVGQVEFEVKILQGCQIRNSGLLQVLSSTSGDR